MSDEMDNAKLNLSFRKDGFNCFRKAFQAVHAGDENILDASVFQFGDDLHPELRAFRVGCLDAEHILETVERHAKG
jgi:hypothetical protein